jgi:hypothetical protein
MLSNYLLLNSVGMKILVTEAQLSELNRQSEKYLDYLLDKIATGGINSLDDHEKEELLQMSKDENPIDPKKELDIKDIATLFKSFFPKNFNVSVNEDNWNVTLIDKTDESQIRLMVDNPVNHRHFLVIPFADYQPIIRVVVYQERFDGPLNEQMPKNREEVEEFYHEFMENGLPQLIETVNENFEGVA